MISKGNHVNFVCFVLLALGEEAKTCLPFFCSMYNYKTIIIIRFSFCDIQLITLTSTSVILDITKTTSNNCLKFARNLSTGLSVQHI